MTILIPRDATDSQGMPSPESSSSPRSIPALAAGAAGPEGVEGFRDRLEPDPITAQPSRGGTGTATASRLDEFATRPTTLHSTPAED